MNEQRWVLEKQRILTMVGLAEIALWNVHQGVEQLSDIRSSDKSSSTEALEQQIDYNRTNYLRLQEDLEKIYDSANEDLAKADESYNDALARIKSFMKYHGANNEIFYYDHDYNQKNSDL